MDIVLTVSYNIHTKLSVIVYYAPTNEADDDVKDSF